MQVGKAARTTVVCTQGKPTVRENIQAVYGAQVLSTLEPLEAESEGFRLQGFVSSAVKNKNKGNGDRQFLYINGRPVDLPKAVKVINECYKYVASCQCTDIACKVAVLLFWCWFSVVRAAPGCNLLCKQSCCAHSALYDMHVLLCVLN
jgi:hypothetical protein